jgi:hypothetical protein
MLGVKFAYEWKQPLMIARGWIQYAEIVLIFGFFILGILTYYTCNDELP